MTRGDSPPPPPFTLVRGFQSRALIDLLQRLAHRFHNPDEVEDDNLLGMLQAEEVFHPVCRDVVPYEDVGTSM